MFDKVQKASTSSSDWSPAQLQKQDNFSPQPQQEKPSSFSMSTKGEDTWQYLSVKGKRGRGKGKEKTFNLYPLTFSQNPIPS